MVNLDEFESHYEHPTFEGTHRNPRVSKIDSHSRYTETRGTGKNNPLSHSTTMRLRHREGAQMKALRRDYHLNGIDDGEVS